MKNKIFHGLAALVLFGIPLVINSHAQFLDLSVGAVLNALYLTISQIAKPTAPIQG